MTVTVSPDRPLEPSSLETAVSKLRGAGGASRSTLKALAATPEVRLRVTEVAAACRITLAAATGRLMRLESLGLVSKTTDQHWNVRYGITKLGRETAALPDEAFTPEPRPPAKPKAVLVCPACRDPLPDAEGKPRKDKTCGSPECRRRFAEYMTPPLFPDRVPPEAGGQRTASHDLRDIEDVESFQPPDRILTPGRRRLPHKGGPRPRPQSGLRSR
jgi:hypothetical protein